MAEGMTAPESAAAIEASIRERRRVGTAAQERRRTEARAAKPVAVKLPAVEMGVCNVLIIEGMGSVGEDVNFISDSILQHWDWCPSMRLGIPRSPDAPPPPTRHVRVSFAHGERVNARDACQRAIASKRFHAIVIADLTTNHAAFEEHLGPGLLDFVELGGVVVFQSSEGTELPPTLQRLFGTEWEASGYYRTNWEPVVETLKVRVTLCARAFSAKACSLRNVPYGERRFGTSPTSRTQSAAPGLAHRPVGQRQEPVSVMSGAETDDFDVCIAVHSVGRGFVAYFGDVNGEPETATLINSCCQASQIELPLAAARQSLPEGVQPVNEGEPLTRFEKIVGAMLIAMLIILLVAFVAYSLDLRNSYSLVILLLIFAWLNWPLAWMNQH